jgi:hypothetical protein
MQATLHVDGRLSPALPSAPVPVRFEGNGAPVSAHWDGSLVVSVRGAQALARLVAAEPAILLPVSFDSRPTAKSVSREEARLWLMVAQSLVRVKALQNRPDATAWDLIRIETRVLAAWAEELGLPQPSAEHRTLVSLAPLLRQLAAEGDHRAVLDAAAPGLRRRFESAVKAEIAEKGSAHGLLSHWLRDVTAILPLQSALVLGLPVSPERLAEVTAPATVAPRPQPRADDYFQQALVLAYLMDNAPPLDGKPILRELLRLWRDALLTAEVSLQRSPILAP